MPGDVLVLPTGIPHRLSSAPTSTVAPSIAWSRRTWVGVRVGSDVEIASLVGLLTAEVAGHAAGSRVAAARLIDLLLIAAIRSWAAQQRPSVAPSCLAALHDPTVAHARGARWSPRPSNSAVEETTTRPSADRVPTSTPAAQAAQAGRSHAGRHTNTGADGSRCRSWAWPLDAVEGKL
ncbi:MAG: cupin domain-containing protein [Acidimicrobiales bacterium]